MMDESALHGGRSSAAERFEWWCEFVGKALVPTRLTTEHADDFDAGIRLLEAGPAQLSVMWFSPLRSARTSALIRRSDPELVALGLSVRGIMNMTQCGRHARIRAGDLLLYDTSHPFDGITDAGDGPVEMLLMQLTRALLPLPADHVGRLLGARFAGDAGIGGLLAALLIGLSRDWASLRPSDITHLGGIAVDLLTALLAHHLDLDSAVPEEGRRQVLLLSMRAFIDSHLGDPRLSVRTVADAHNISVRYVHRLFQREGTTIGALIRQRRLERRRRELAEPRLAGRPVYAIAARWGFPQPAAFTRAFRAADGMTPSDYRHRSALAANNSAPCGKDTAG